MQSISRWLAFSLSGVFKNCQMPCGRHAFHTALIRKSIQTQRPLLRRLESKDSSHGSGEETSGDTDNVGGRLREEATGQQTFKMLSPEVISQRGGRWRRC